MLIGLFAKLKYLFRTNFTKSPNKSMSKKPSINVPMGAEVYFPTKVIKKPKKSITQTPNCKFKKQAKASGIAIKAPIAKAATLKGNTETA